MGRKRKVTDADLLAAFADRRDPFEPLSAAEVAEELGLTRRATSDRLGSLSEESPPVLRTKKIGARGRVWWPNSDLWYPDLSAMELRDVAVENVLERTRGRDPGSGGPDEPALERALDGLDLPGSGEVLVERRAAIRDIYLHIRKEGEATKRELSELIDPEAVGYRDADSAWSNLIIRKDVLRELPGIVPPGEGGHYYHYISE